MSDRMPPYNKQAEAEVLGSMLHHNECIDEIRKFLKETDFYFDNHQKIVAAIYKLNTNGSPVDLVTLASELKTSGQFDDAGGAKYLAELWDMHGTWANSDFYAKIVADKSLKRSLIYVLTESVKNCYDESGTGEQLIGEAQKEVNSLADGFSQGEPVTLTQALAEVHARIDAKAKGAPLGVTTGYPALEQYLCGWQRGELILIACRPSVGKTAFVCNAIRHACRSEYKVLFISLEQSRIEIGERLTCIQSKVDSYKLRSAKLTDRDHQALTTSLQEMHPWKLDIDDAKGQTITRICSTIRRHKRKKKTDIVFLDYVQFIEPEDRRPQRYEQIGVISRRLKNLAGDLKIPLVCCAQLNRTEGPEPKLSDLRESGNLEQDADTVMFLNRPPVDSNSTPSKEVIKLIIAKNRNGPIGSVDFTFHRPTLTFDVLQKEF